MDSTQGQTTREEIKLHRKTIETKSSKNIRLNLTNRLPNTSI